MSNYSRLIQIGAAATALCSLSIAAPEPPIYNSEATRHPETGLQGMVSSREKRASEAALEVLKNGGNAVDAAVTLAFAMAVTTPQAGNIGGGGFMMIHSADTNATVALDYREKAPLAATRDMYLGPDGEVDKELSRYSHLSAGVPGTVAGLSAALEKYGTISLAEAIQPAIKLARNGFPVNEDLYQSLKTGKERVEKHAPHALAYFYDDEGVPFPPGHLISIPELADTLELIAKEGPDAFYKGAIADLIVSDMEKHGGIITHEDLARYEPVFRNPVRGTYKGYEIVSMPPPSSGGAHIVQILNILEPLDLHSKGHNSAASIHLMAEAMKYAYADRSKHLGDSDFNPVPLEWITSKSYADTIREKMNLNRATPSVDILPGEPIHEGLDTTHFSVMDRYGNAVSNTYTINFTFGSKIMPPGTGFFLNNEMDDFSSKPGVPNAYGLIGGEFNAIEAEKRMLSSMSPTIVLKDGTPVLLTGSRGGSQIISVSLQVILNVIEHQMNIAEAVAAPRIHHQWLPDTLGVEKGVSPDTIALLEQMGYEVRQGRAMGTANSVTFEDGIFYGGSDPRRPDSTAIGY
ncbi:gamma-glutamyltransferase [Pelagicoccus sp. SDUM812003]|uniref:gamma-glutamyltransferase n=1 Tax=Pelagicoccus sp. SDUM812003 TaxID=3041267 RepID=UPI00280F3452|nr:gamma-glutamyltransferase [Pelagicoccus sp. SDUM812003]MDQ8204074.1 gamma-glutamyltransferase [Pelagicoccus sp. SDUM812003]